MYSWFSVAYLLKIEVLYKTNVITLLFDAFNDILLQIHSFDKASKASSSYSLIMSLLFQEQSCAKSKYLVYLKHVALLFISSKNKRGSFKLICLDFTDKTGSHNAKYSKIYKKQFYIHKIECFTNICVYSVHLITFF